MELAITILTALAVALALAALVVARQALGEARATTRLQQETSRDTARVRRIERLLVLAQRIAELAVAGTTYPLTLREHNVALAIGSLHVALAPLADLNLPECRRLAALQVADPASRTGPHPSPTADFCERARPEVEAHLH